MHTMPELGAVLLLQDVGRALRSHQVRLASSVAGLGGVDLSPSKKYSEAALIGVD